MKIVSEPKQKTIHPSQSIIGRHYEIVDCLNCQYVGEIVVINEERKMIQLRNGVIWIDIDELSKEFRLRKLDMGTTIEI